MLHFIYCHRFGEQIIINGLYTILMKNALFSEWHYTLEAVVIATRNKYILTQPITKFGLVLEAECTDSPTKDSEQGDETLRQWTRWWNTCEEPLDKHCWHYIIRQSSWFEICFLIKIWVDNPNSPLGIWALLWLHQRTLMKRNLF